MKNVRLFGFVVLAAILALGFIACGGGQPEPQAPVEDDYFADIVGDVDTSEVEDEEEAPVEGAYEGPTQLTVNLKVINNRSPEGSYKLLDSDDKVVVENGKLGEPVEVKQGVYAIEFQSPLVFANPTFRVDEVEVQGEEMTVSKTFPAGQITLHTYRGKNSNSKCKPVSFSVNFETESKELPGKGKTCKPTILEIGSYELLLDVTKKIVQPVKIQVSSEQVSSAAVKLER